MPTYRPEGFETDVDRIVREAMDAGDFDNLPGEGKPIPGVGSSDDEYWWVRKWLERNVESDDSDDSGSS